LHFKVVCWLVMMWWWLVVVGGIGIDTTNSMYLYIYNNKLLMMIIIVMIMTWIPTQRDERFKVRGLSCSLIPSSPTVEQPVLSVLQQANLFFNQPKQNCGFNHDPKLNITHDGSGWCWYIC
jgi:hypothetical protein